MSKFFVFILTILSNLALCQFREGSLLVGATYHYVEFEGYSPKHAIGINGEFMMSNRFGVELSLAGGQGYFNYGIASVMAPPVILISYLTRNLDEGSFGSFIGLLLFIPALLEQTNFHIPIRDNLQLIPYISIYKFKYIYDTNPVNKYHYFCSGAIGTKLSLITKNNWCISANCEISRLYRASEYSGQLDNPASNDGYQVSFNIGYIFKDIRK
jgi:hypothetical protein